MFFHLPCSPFFVSSVHRLSSLVQYAHLTCEWPVNWRSIFVIPPVWNVWVCVCGCVWTLSNDPRSTAQAEMEPWCHLFWCHKSMGLSLPGASAVLSAWRQITSHSHHSPVDLCFSATALSKWSSLRIVLKISHCINLYQVQCISHCISVWHDLWDASSSWCEEPLANVWMGTLAFSY